MIIIIVMITTTITLITIHHSISNYDNNTTVEPWNKVLQYNT